MSQWRLNRSDPRLREQAIAAACEAASSHVALLKAGGSGGGIDRHLLGLRAMMWEDSSPGVAQPALFQLPVFARSGGTAAWKISSSNNSYMKYEGAGAFACVQADGYGVMYLYRKHWGCVLVESKHSCKATDSGAMLAAIERALEDTLTLLTAGSESKL